MFIRVYPWSLAVSIHRHWYIDISLETFSATKYYLYLTEFYKKLMQSKCDLISNEGKGYSENKNRAHKHKP